MLASGMLAFLPLLGAVQAFTTPPSLQYSPWTCCCFATRTTSQPLAMQSSDSEDEIAAARVAALERDAEWYRQYIEGVGPSTVDSAEETTPPSAALQAEAYSLEPEDEGYFDTYEEGMYDSEEPYGLDSPPFEPRSTVGRGRGPAAGRFQPPSSRVPYEGDRPGRQMKSEDAIERAQQPPDMRAAGPRAPPRPASSGDSLKAAPGVDAEALAKAEAGRAAEKERIRLKWAEDLEKLLGLGYSVDEAEQISNDMVALITERGLKRPKGGIPADWLKLKIGREGAAPPQRRREGAPPATGRRGRGREGRGRRDDEGRSGGYRREQREQQSRYDDGIDDYGYGGGKKKREAWTVQPGVDPRGDRAVRKFLGEDRERDDREIVQWPTMDEFRQMLRKESNLRLDIVGPWAADLVAVENQLRLAAYEKWLEAINPDMERPPRYGDMIDVEFPEDDDDWDYSSTGSDWERGRKRGEIDEVQGGRRSIQRRGGGGRKERARPAGFNVIDFFSDGIEGLQEAITEWDEEADRRYDDDLRRQEEREERRGRAPRDVRGRPLASDMRMREWEEGDMYDERDER
ncbi:unnamed protein product [Chrysoparadoxa australica]